MLNKNKQLGKRKCSCDVWFQQISILLSEIPRKRGISKAKMFAGKYRPELEFPEGWGGGGVSDQKPSVGGV